jgi:predicted RNase H-like HicB family nuclease
MKEQVDYPFFVRPLSKDEGGGYLIEFPDLPGCMSDGETPEEAIENGRDALKGVLALKRELGHTIPRHRSCERAKVSKSTEESTGPPKAPTKPKRR